KPLPPERSRLQRKTRKPTPHLACACRWSRHTERPHPPQRFLNTTVERAAIRAETARRAGLRRPITPQEMRQLAEPGCGASAETGPTTYKIRERPQYRPLSANRNSKTAM